MKVYLQKSMGHWFDDFVYICVRPLLNIGANIKSFDDLNHAEFFEREPFDKEDILIGSVESTQIFFNKIGVKCPKFLGYPDELKKYLGREIYETTYGNKPNEYPYFIKPSQSIKLFTGSLVESDNHIYILENYMGVGFGDNLPVYISEPMDFVSEYRCFVHEGNIKGIKHYLGDNLVFPNPTIIKSMVEDYKSSPISYALDVGIADDGETYLVEVNDFWALGSYGLDGSDYYLMIRDRMREIKFGV